MKDKLSILIHNLKELSPMAVAFSGGLDSRFLCYMAIKNNIDILAIHVKGPHISESEDLYAKDWAQKNKLPYLEIYTNPLLIADVAANTHQRCYYCKQNIFSEIKNALAKNNESYRILCDGGNADDLKKFRPGKKAVLEASISSPLEDLSKSEIRTLAELTGMDNPGQKARPCLLTRLNYDMKVEENLLKQISKCEEEIFIFLAENNFANIDFRLRMIPDPILHITELPKDIEKKIKNILEDNNFKNCPVITLHDLSGYFDK